MLNSVYLKLRHFQKSLISLIGRDAMLMLSVGFIPYLSDRKSKISESDIANNPRFLFLSNSRYYRTYCLTNII